MTLDEVEEFDAIILSPGPGLPKDAGIMPVLLKRYAPTKKILGVCLVHHGVTIPSNILQTEEPLFRELPSRIDTGRYHSWVIDKATIPSELIITATDDDGEVMSIRHREFDVCGVQFHPESVLTPNGLKMIENWVNS